MLIKRVTVTIDPNTKELAIVPAVESAVEFATGACHDYRN